MSEISYKSAGVNIAAGNEAVELIKDKVKTTFAPCVLSNLGGFAALVDLKDVLGKYKHPVLVQSIDGVGTKTIIARMMQKYDTLGIDLLSASSNDILVCGAEPLTLLDYIASDKIEPKIIAEIVSGMVKACKENGVSLVGGETAEMPSTYSPREHDLVGIVTGIVEKEKIITGQNIRAGDKILGFLSNGLHTNGYSLARKLFFDVAGLSVDSKLPELSDPVGETLLKPHINYAKPILDVLAKNAGVVKGMAHITGGGLLENIPRVLPNSCTAEITKDSWDVPDVFKVMQELGKIAEAEMYRTFNMGIGFVLITAADGVAAIMRQIEKLHIGFTLLEIGSVKSGHKEVVII